MVVPGLASPDPIPQWAKRVAWVVMGALYAHRAFDCRPAVHAGTPTYPCSMAIPFARQVAVFNKHVTNRILGPITWYLPMFGRIEHVGRTTGRRYVAPMIAFRDDGGRRLTFALTYGPEASWVMNALAAGEFVFDSRWSGRLHLVHPQVIHDPKRRAMPWIVRRALGVMRVDDFLEASADNVEMANHAQ
jgi:hypothetical protein